MISHKDEVFAPIDRDLELERIAGGNETEVYRSDDQRFVVKLKHELGGSTAEALAQARTMRAAAEQFAASLGQRHTIPSYYLLARDSAGQVQPLVIQPYLQNGTVLFDIDYGALSQQDRALIAGELREIIRRSLHFYWRTSSMPDLYGRTSGSPAERARQRSLGMLPRRLWSFLIERNLLRAHNLLLTSGPNRRVVLVDYDFVRRSRLYRLVYYTVRWMLFWRDHTLIMLMRRHGKVPGPGAARSSSTDYTD